MLLPPPKNSQCLKCLRFRGMSVVPDETKESYHCEAFAAIPDVILTNSHDHKKPFVGDGGKLFQANTETTGEEER